MTHVLGWTTVALDIAGAGFLFRYLTVAMRESRTWMRRMPVPRMAEARLTMFGGDHIGLV